VAVLYEAGPTGFGLARGLRAAGVRCEVAAPSKLQRPSGDRVKTDARDAEHLCRLLRLDGFTAVAVTGGGDRGGQGPGQGQGGLPHRSDAGQELECRVFFGLVICWFLRLRNGFGTIPVRLHSGSGIPTPSGAVSDCNAVRSIEQYL